MHISVSKVDNDVYCVVVARYSEGPIVQGHGSPRARWSDSPRVRWSEGPMVRGPDGPRIYGINPIPIF